MSTHSSAAVNYTVVPWQIIPHGFKNRPARELRNAAMLHSDNYYEAEKYAKNVVFLCVAIVALGVVPGLLHRLRCRSPRLARKITGRLPGYYSFLALLRRITYHQPKPLSFFPYWRFPALGHFILNWSFCVGVVLYCFGIQPYYRLNREWGSPPLAIRAGMLANGLFPILFALSTKVNVITVLTAISHERLQLYHQWIGRLLLLLTVIHFVPFVWQPLHEGGLQDLKSYWYSDPTYWTGSVAMGVLLWIILSGSRVARNWKYEFFVINHIFSVLVFLAFYFLHTNDYLNSWRYIWVATYLWAAAVFIRWCHSSLASRYFVRMKASVEVSLHLEKEEEGQVIRIAIDTPVKWKPGQHVFLRFPTLAPLQSHPFTIITLPHPLDNRESQAVCIARVLNGNTLSLRDHIKKRLAVNVVDLEKSPQENRPDLIEVMPTMGAGIVAASIDGPYGADGSIVASYQSALFVVGGLGLSFALPILMCLSRRSGDTREIRLVWSVRTTALLDWFEPYLTSIFQSCEEHGINIEMHIYCTREEEEAKKRKETAAPFAHFHHGRPDATMLVKAAYKDYEQVGMTSLAIVTCGPGELMRSTANAAAWLQGKLWKRTSPMQEVYLVSGHPYPKI
ncbi:hypothetical protein CBS101457_004057 [Exobasidium rhododendri]|nr:hypothetical protein CBS101457_004057 [Exobasidium rhododendri]